MVKAKDVVKQIRKATRRKFSAEEKIRIVLEGLRGQIAISDLCRRESIPASAYYKWSKSFLESGKNGKNSGFGYEALRVPFRIGLDSMWFDRVEAKEFLSSFNCFLESQMKTNGRIYCEYNYSGQAVKAYESPAFYSCYYFAMKLSNSDYADSVFEKIQEFVLNSDDGLYYQSKDEYYSNCLSWLADGYESGCIKNLFRQGVKNDN